VVGAAPGAGGSPPGDAGETGADEGALDAAEGPGAVEGAADGLGVDEGAEEGGELEVPPDGLPPPGEGVAPPLGPSGAKRRRERKFQLFR